jgi:shikimate dehydrogenase
MSAIMHNAAFQEQGLDYNYSLKMVPAESLEEAVNKLRTPDVLGANVTIPHKSTILRYLDEITPEAKMIGAVNTIIKRKDTLIGINTDASGGVQALKEVNLDLDNARIVILGAGGAARALTYKLAPIVAKIKIINRTYEKAFNIAKEMKEKKVALIDSGGINDLEESIKKSNILINATPLGMYPKTHISPVPSEFLHRGLLVFDLVYNPIETKLIREAKMIGARVLSGVKMLVYQGAIAYKKWTGLNPPIGLMIKVVEDALGVKNQ